MSNEEKERDRLHSELMLLNKILSTLIDGKNRRIQGDSLVGVERDFIDVVLDAAGALTVVYNREGQIMCFNRACEEATGFSSKEITGKYVWDLSPTEEDAQKVKEEFQRLRVGQSANRFETFWVKKGGSKRLITWENTVLSEAKSKEGYIIGMGIDITGHRKLEESLRESEEKYRKLVETANDAIFIADAETGIILDINEKARELVGLPPEKIIGMRQHQLHPREEALKYRAIFEEAVRQGGGNYNDLTVLQSDGGKLPVDISASVTEIGGKKVIQGIFRDISERKKMEEDLLRNQKLESVGLLAGGIAHDFNNLLTAILSTIEMAKIQPDSHDRILKSLSDVEMISLRAQRLTQQLLTFSKGGDPAKKAVSMPEIVKESAEFALSGSNVTCELIIPEGTWGAEVDPAQIGQAISNIIINAKQAMPGGGKVLISFENVTLASEEIPALQEGKYVRISIRDSGAGISREHGNKVFDPYFTTKEEGSGLGLSTCHSIVLRHEGHVEFESEEGRGTTFHLYLPATAKLPEKSPKRRESQEKGNGKILLMDDEELIRSAVGAVLAHTGYEVQFAKDGEEAIELYANAAAANNPFDAVIMDLTVPGGGGGKEAIRELLEIDPEIRAIVSSSYSTDSLMIDFQKHGFKAALKKPYCPVELINTIHEVIRGARE